MELSALDTAAIGHPITRLGVSFFPVYLPDNRIPEIAAGKDSGLIVRELEHPSVPHLLAENPTSRPILVIEGEHFVGGWQNRTANATALIAPGAKLKIPVTCLEAGRWGGHAPENGDPSRMAPETALAPRSVRREIRTSVSASLEARAGHDADQGAAWRAVSAELRRQGAASPTEAATEAEDAAFRAHRPRHLAAQELAERGPLPGQNGVCITHGSRVRTVEVFGAHALLRAWWRGLVRQNLADPPQQADPPSIDRALWGVRRLTRTPSQSRPGIGLGRELRARDQVLAGVALTLEDNLVHASAMFAA